MHGLWSLDGTAWPNSLMGEKFRNSCGVVSHSYRGYEGLHMWLKYKTRNSAEYWRANTCKTTEETAIIYDVTTIKLYYNSLSPDVFPFCVIENSSASQTLTFIWSISWKYKSGLVQLNAVNSYIHFVPLQRHVGKCFDRMLILIRPNIYPTSFSIFL